jgi:RNA polymerase sigma-70 factor (ECF subfamily)
VEAARAGDEQAWESLYRSVYPRLRGYLTRRVGPDHAEDVMSDTMTRAVAGIDRFEWGPAGFDGWLFGIARRAAADHHRRNSRRRREAGAVMLLSTDRTDPGPAPDEPAVISVEHAQVRRVFARLRPEDRELLELRVIAGLSPEQVGAILGKKSGAVRTAQSRALNRLRGLMDADDD